jgi:hypothetical protein
MTPFYFYKKWYNIIIIFKYIFMMEVFNYNHFMGGYSNGFWFWGMLALFWVLPWKGYALWKAARKGSVGWFVALLFINTMALLEILYIFVFSEKYAPVKTKKMKKKR